MKAATEQSMYYMTPFTITDSDKSQDSGTFNGVRTGKGHEGTYWDVVMFHILIGFRLYRCIHLSKLNKCTLKTFAFIIWNIHLKRKKCKKY